MGATPRIPGRSIVPTETPNTQAFVDSSKDPNVQWRVTTETDEKNFPDLETLVTVAKSWAAENMFSLASVPLRYAKFQKLLWYKSKGIRD